MLTGSEDAHSAVGVDFKVFDCTFDRKQSRP